MIRRDRLEQAVEQRLTDNHVNAEGHEQLVNAVIDAVIIETGPGAQRAWCDIFIKNLKWDAEQIADTIRDSNHPNHYDGVAQGSVAALADIVAELTKAVNDINCR